MGLSTVNISMIGFTLAVLLISSSPNLAVGEEGFGALRVVEGSVAHTTPRSPDEGPRWIPQCGHPQPPVCSCSKISDDANPYPRKTKPEGAEGSSAAPLISGQTQLHPPAKQQGRAVNPRQSCYSLDLIHQLDSALTNQELYSALQNMQRIKVPEPNWFLIKFKLKVFNSKLTPCVNAVYVGSLRLSSLPPTLRHASISVLLKKEKDS
ncbi:unnamed protein product [Menidia menidia]|uniref:(Atlantic silverside) hypothetical protein n=1 Tax=Menidia menidia TaxID=238744 RepID=A0A8S4BPK6_9TELE|nr:unnamed protein product [Menidia menidia]